MQFTREDVQTIINLLRARADVEEAKGLTEVNFELSRKAADMLEALLQAQDAALLLRPNQLLGSDPAGKVAPIEGYTGDFSEQI